MAGFFIACAELVSPRWWLIPRLMRQATRLVAMPRYRPNSQDNPEKPGGEGWLVNSQQQLVCQFKPDAPSAHGQWVSVRTYSWIPPRQPVPQTQRRMLRHNAVEAWQIMLKTGWQRCQPPMHWSPVEGYTVPNKSLDRDLNSIDYGDAQGDYGCFGNNEYIYAMNRLHLYPLIWVSNSSAPSITGHGVASKKVNSSKMKAMSGVM